jgi:urea transport system permease protein
LTPAESFLHLQNGNWDGLALKAVLLALYLALLATACSAAAASNLPAEIIKDLSSDDSDARIRAVQALPAAGAALAIQVLDALENGQLKVSGGTAVIDDDGKVTDLATGQAATLPKDAQEITVNNRLRREIENARSVMKLFSALAAERLSAAQSLVADAGEGSLPLIEKAIAAETDTQIKDLLRLARAAILLKSTDPQARLQAAKRLGESGDPQVRAMLGVLLEKRDGQYIEPDATVREAARISISGINQRLAFSNALAGLFTGISLGSVLLLAALGLAITYGLIGVINMAHGELMMIGAYTTYVVQGLFRQWIPGHFDWYPLAAVPAAFIIAALVGIALERVVIRFLYGRPLETLLATWGISLMLIQLMRTLFGAQNVAVENPAWLSGGMSLTAGVVLPYNRIAIIGFAVLVLAATWLILNRTRLGLFIRAVTQNRAMASCSGVPTARVDMLAFGLGSGIAGLGGVALSQIGNVGPDLGQSYIVDSFMVVVLGGVGQLAGTVSAAMGLGLLNKLLEGQIGAVLAKIVILVGIILFIQKRPQGLFAIKGRFVEQ